MLARRFIFIRHGNDEVKKSRHRQDPSITKESRKEARELGVSLIEKHGVPLKVFCSPMYRARTTEKYLRKDVQKTFGLEDFPQPIITNRISRYFTSVEREELSVNRETFKYLDLTERNEEFRERIAQFVGELQMLGPGTYWIITHALVLKKLSEMLNFRHPSHIDFLWYIVLSF